MEGLQGDIGGPAVAAFGSVVDIVGGDITAGRGVPAELCTGSGDIAYLQVLGFEAIGGDKGTVGPVALGKGTVGCHSPLVVLS